MNPSHRLGIAVIAAALSFGSVQAQAPDAAHGVASAAKAPAFKAHVLTRTEFDALLAKPEQVLIIDVRRPDELSSIGGFPVYLSIQWADLEKSLAYIPKDRTIVTVSNHAGRSGRAADLLASRGFKVAGTIGAQNYEEQGGTLVRPVAPAKAASAAAAATKPST
jgi:rhodanese-related sulfurtransferase